MRSSIDIAVPAVPDGVEGANSEFTVIYPIQRSGRFVQAGDILFALDIGPAILEVEAPYKGTYTSHDVSAGALVKPEQVVASIDITTNEPKQGAINASSVIGFLLGAVSATVVTLVVLDV